MRIQDESARRKKFEIAKLFKVENKSWAEMGVPFEVSRQQLQKNNVSATEFFSSSGRLPRYRRSHRTLADGEVVPDQKMDVDSPLSDVTEVSFKPISRVLCSTCDAE